MYNPSIHPNSFCIIVEYPRELKLSPEREQALREYLNIELLTHRAERSKWVQDLKRWQEDYWATPSTEIATFPFRGAANTIIPLSAIAVESIHARELTTLFALEQFVTCKIRNPEQQDVQYDLERAIDFELLKGSDIYHFCDQTLLENKKLGTCVGKVGYEKIIKTAIRETGGVETEFDIVVKQGPTMDAVPLVNFLMPFTAIDPQLSPWCGEEHLTNFYDIESKVQSGFFRIEVLEELKGFYSVGQVLSSTPYTQMVRDEQNQKPIQYPREIGWNEIWLAFDIDSDPSDTNSDSGNQPGSIKKKEIVVHYHWPSQKFFSIRYNPFSDLHRPYRIGNYFPMEHRWAGIGIGKQNEQFQEMVTTVHRQRLDNATLANMRMFKAKQGSGIGPNEPLFPGKIFMLDDIADFEAIVGGSEVYPSGYNDEQSLVIYSQQRTGVNELTLGMPQSGTPGTATGDLTRVQEYNRKFDYNYNNAKRFIDTIVLDTLCNQAQYGFRDRRYFDMIGPNGQIVEQLLQMDPNDIRSQLFYEVKVVGQGRNDLVDRNNWTQYAGMLTQYYTQMIQLAEQTQNPQIISAVMSKAMEAGTEAMRQISEGFDIRGVERLLLPPQLIQAIGGMQIGSPQLQSGGGTNNSPPAPGQGKRMGNSPQIVR